jgi:hypothetical protein
LKGIENINKTKHGGAKIDVVMLSDTHSEKSARQETINKPLDTSYVGLGATHDPDVTIAGQNLLGHVD